MQGDQGARGGVLQVCEEGNFNSLDENCSASGSPKWRPPADKGMLCGELLENAVAFPQFIAMAVVVRE